MLFLVREVRERGTRRLQGTPIKEGVSRLITQRQNVTPHFLAAHKMMTVSG